MKTAAPEPEKGCAPGRTRTFDLRIRNPLLCPAELRAHLLGTLERRSMFLSNFHGHILRSTLMKQQKTSKEVWKSLKTSHLSVAQAKLAEFLKEHRERVSNGNSEGSAKMTLGEAAAIHLRNLDDNPRIKPRTRDYWRECLAALQKNWPGLNETELRKISPGRCRR